MRRTGMLLVAYSMLVCILGATSAGKVLFWFVVSGGAAGLVGGVQLASNRRQGFGMAFVGTSIVLAIGLGFLGLRVFFTIRNGGMEGPDGFGSPLAFLIGLAFEQMLFSVPAFGLLLALKRSLRHAE